MNWTWIYVAAIYAIVVAIARRCGVDLPKRFALFFYALVLLFFFKPMTQDYVNVPVDFLKTLPPWTFVTDHRVVNREMNDVAMQHAVWAHQVRESWKSLSPPLWNHLAGSGYPLLANGQSSALSPLRLLTLPLDSLGHAMTAQAAFTVLVALTFTFLYCRRRGWSDVASAVASVAFGFGGFLMVWLHFPHVATACFLPAVMFLVDVILERPSLAAFVLAAIVWASIISGGHPETAAHIFVLAVLYVVWIVAVERVSWRRVLPLGGALAVAMLLASPFLIPFAEAVFKSQRYEALQVRPFDVRDLPGKNWQSMVLLLHPHIHGRVPQTGEAGWATPDSLSGFAGILGVAGWIATIVSVVRRRAWRSREMFFAGATVFVLGVILGWPGLGSGIHLIMPLIAHARFRLLLGFLLAIQAAASIDRAQRGERLPMIIGVAVTAVSLTAAFAFVDPAGPLMTALPPVAALAIAALLTVRQHALLPVLIAVIIEMFAALRGWSPPLPGALIYPRTPLITKLEALKSSRPPNDPFRVAGIGPQLFPNTSAMFGLEDIRVHDPMAIARYGGFLRVTAGYDPWNYFAMLRDQNPSVYDFLNVRYLLLDPKAHVYDGYRYAIVYDGVDGRIVENTRALPRFFSVRNVVVEPRQDAFVALLRKHTTWATTALLDHVEPQLTSLPADGLPAAAPIEAATGDEYRLRVAASRPSFIVSSVPWWPGWKVERNGEAVAPIRVNGVFLGFTVPAGQSRVRVWYSPWTFWLGVWLSLATVIALVAAGPRLARRFA
jgi:hypothetical protein